MANKKKKLIELLIDETAELFGVEAISVVKFPALEENFVFFKNDNFLSLAKVDEEQKQLVGAVLIPDKKIPRYDKEENEEYEVFFTKDTIKQAQTLFMQSLKNNSHTLEHKEPISGLTVVESWIKEDEKFDKSNMWGFKNMPVGTWFVQVSAKENPEIWTKIKNKEVRGFSIEGYFTDKIIEMAKKKEIDILDEVCDDCPDEYTLNKIKQVILDNELMPVGALDGEPLFRTKEEANIYGEMFKGCKGFHTHNVDGVNYYMACESHAEATSKEEYNKNGKRKYKKRYKMLDYLAYAKKEALAKYPWNQCINDMMKEYGNKETAAKVCAAIKNRTVK